MWTRAWRFANVYAYAALDTLCTILWFAAAIAVGVWEAAGVKKGSNKQPGQSGPQGKNGGSSGGCSTFAYGSAAKCSTSKASVGFGVIIFLLFVLTSAISIYGLLRYRKTGIMPYGSSGAHGKVEQLPVEDPNKDPWSTNTDELDRPLGQFGSEADLRHAYGQIPAEEEQQGPLLRPSNASREDPFHDAHETHSMVDTQTEDGAHPGRPLSYQSSTNLSIAPPAYEEERPQHGQEILSPSGYVAPSALSPSDYEQTPGGRVNFPMGNYGADFR